MLKLYCIFQFCHLHLVHFYSFYFTTGSSYLLAHCFTTLSSVIIPALNSGAVNPDIWVTLRLLFIGCPFPDFCSHFIFCIFLGILNFVLNIFLHKDAGFYLKNGSCLLALGQVQPGQGDPFLSGGSNPAAATSWLDFSIHCFPSAISSQCGNQGIFPEYLTSHAPFSGLSYSAHDSPSLKI
jgi:hypothetical protein